MSQPGRTAPGASPRIPTWWCHIGSVTTLSAGVNGRGPGARHAMPCDWGELQLPHSAACWAGAAPSSSVLGAQAPLNSGAKQLLVNAGAQQHSAGSARPHPCVCGWAVSGVGGSGPAGTPPVGAVLAGAEVFHLPQILLIKRMNYVSLCCQECQSVIPCPEHHSCAH